VLPPGSAVQIQRQPGYVAITIEVPTHPPHGEDMLVVLRRATGPGASR